MFEGPVVAAPMAGGPTTAALSVAAAAAGAFPFVPGGYLTGEGLAREIGAVRGEVGSFGVNLFVPGATAPDLGDFRAYAAALRPEAEVHGLTLDPDPVTDDDAWAEKIDLLVADPVAVVSFTFGLPDAASLARLRRGGSTLLMSVTDPDEARAAADAGFDGLVVQGPAAGGHSATFDPARAIATVGTADLVWNVRAVVGLPIVAAGGVDGPGAVAELLDAGAEAVAVGTLLMRTDEAGTSRTHRDALADPRFTTTVVTHAFTGRPARALRNGFVERHQAEAPLGYPAIHHLTRPLRRAAAAAGDADRLHLWAGTGYRNAPTGSVRSVVEMLAGSSR